MIYMSKYEKHMARRYREIRQRLLAYKIARKDGTWRFLNAKIRL